MSEIFDKWNEEFSISDPNTEPRNFLLLKDYLFHFDKNKADHIIDGNNELEIVKRVNEKTKGIMNDLNELNDKKSELEENNQQLSQKCNLLHDENNSLKITRSEDIEAATEVVKESKDEMIQEIRQERDLLRNDKEILAELTELLKDKTKEDKSSSFDIGAEGESDILMILQNGCWDEVIDNHSKDHAGDFLIKYNDKKLLIDVKNLISIAQGKEVLKLVKDMEMNKCDGGAIISLQSGIINPSTNTKAEVIDFVLISGKSILLLSNANKYPEYINSSLKLLDKFSANSENNFQINEKYKEEIIKSILKMKKEIESEKKSFQRMIVKKTNDLENLENTLKHMIGPMNDYVDEESTEDEGKKLTVPIMRQKLIEQEIDIKGLKNKALKDKYNEFFSGQLSP